MKFFGSKYWFFRSIFFLIEILDLSFEIPLILKTSDNRILYHWRRSGVCIVCPLRGRPFVKYLLWHCNVECIKLDLIFLFRNIHYKNLGHKENAAAYNNKFDWQVKFHGERNWSSLVVKCKIKIVFLKKLLPWIYARHRERRKGVGLRSRWYNWMHDRLNCCWKCFLVPGVYGERNQSSYVV